MEKSSQSSFLKNLAVAFGDGLLFGVAMKLAQGPSKTREDTMTDLGPLAERLRKVDDHIQTIDKDSLAKFGEGLDGRVLEKVIVALEARLTEHVGQVDRRLAEIDAQVALDLKAVDTHTAAQTNAVEKAIQTIEGQVREYVTAAQQSSADQISGVDQKLSALQEALPAKFREIIEAVRQSMEARVALELTELENRVSARGIAPEKLAELQTSLRGEVEALSGKLTAELHELAAHQQSQAAPLHQALQQLETKLTTLREELPPKIRQIVEAVEASMDARITAGEQQATARTAALEHALEALRAESPHAAGFKQAIDDNLRAHAEQVGALDQKLTALQEELPPKIKAIVDAVRESLDARMAVELQGIDERHTAQLHQTEARVAESQEQFRRQLAAESKTPELQQGVSKLQADLAATEARLNQTHEVSVSKLHADLSAMDARLHAAENIPAQIDTAISGLRQSLESRLAAEIHALEDRTSARSPELDKALQYTSLLEARIQVLEQKVQHSADETVNIAVERVWQALESRLQQRSYAPPAPVQQAESITGLRQKSTSAEQSVLDLIAGIGQLFEKPAPRAAAEPVAAVHVESALVEPVLLEPAHVEPPPPPVAVHEPVHVEPAHVEPVHVQAAHPEPVEPQPTVVHPAPEPEAKAKAEQTPETGIHVMQKPEPVHVPDHTEAPVAAASAAIPETAAEFEESKPTDKPPVILFKPKEAGRKWRIPFVSTF